jgi:hypothetical protein
MGQRDRQYRVAGRPPWQAQQQPRMAAPGAEVHAGLGEKQTRECARVHVQLCGPIGQRGRERGIADQLAAQSRKPGMARHGHVQRQRWRGLDPVEDALWDPLLAPDGRGVQPQRDGAHDERAQQRHDRNDLALRPQACPRAGLDEHRAHGDGLGPMRI